MVADTISRKDSRGLPWKYEFTYDGSLLFLFVFALVVFVFATRAVPFHLYNRPSFTSLPKYPPIAFQK